MTGGESGQSGRDPAEQAAQGMGASVRLRRAALFAAARNRLGLTQVEVAERAGVSEPTIVDLEKGRGTPHGETVLRVCDVLETEPDKLALPTPTPLLVARFRAGMTNRQLAEASDVSLATLVRLQTGAGTRSPMPRIAEGLAQALNTTPEELGFTKRQPPQRSSSQRRTDPAGAPQPAPTSPSTSDTRTPATPSRATGPATPSRATGPATPSRATGPATPSRATGPTTPDNARRSGSKPRTTARRQQEPVPAQIPLRPREFWVLAGPLAVWTRQPLPAEKLPDPPRTPSLTDHAELTRRGISDGIALGRALANAEKPPEEQPGSDATPRIRKVVAAPRGGPGNPEHAAQAPSRGPGARRGTTLHILIDARDWQRGVETLVPPSGRAPRTASQATYTQALRQGVQGAWLLSDAHARIVQAQQQPTLVEEGVTAHDLHVAATVLRRGLGPSPANARPRSGPSPQPGTDRGRTGAEPGGAPSARHPSREPHGRDGPAHGLGR